MTRSVFVLVVAVMAVTFSGCSSPRPARSSDVSGRGRRRPDPVAGVPRAPGGSAGRWPSPSTMPTRGASISIAVNRHPATDRRRRVGALVVNPGGPGVSGVDFAYDAIDGLLDPVLVQDFDIVGFDPRGVGASSPIECADGPTLDRLNHLDPDPRTPAEEAALIAGAKELAGDCEQRSGALLPFVATVDVARDLDALRVALGETKLTYLGFSYGTLLGATYASLFPTRVRALALDGALDPAVDEGTMSVEQAVAFEQSLNRFLQECATSSSCPFVADGAPTLRAAFDTLVARIAAAPLADEAGPAGRASGRAAGGRGGRGGRRAGGSGGAGGSAGTGVGPGEAFIAILGELYEPTDWPALAAELAAAQHGDGSLMRANFDAYVGRRPDGAYSNEEVANVAIDCVRPADADARRNWRPWLRRRGARLRTSVDRWCGPRPTAWTGRSLPSPRPAPCTRPARPRSSWWARPATPSPRSPGPGPWRPSSGRGCSSPGTATGTPATRAARCVRRAVDAYLTTLSLPSPAESDCAS